MLRFSRVYCISAVKWGCYSQLHSTQPVFPSFPKFSLFQWYSTHFFLGGGVHCVACGALVTWTEIKHLPSALFSHNLHRRTTQSSPKNCQGRPPKLLIFLYLIDCSRDYMQRSTFPLYSSVCHIVIILLIFFHMLSYFQPFSILTPEYKALWNRNLILIVCTIQLAHSRD